jgi:hypothetical protein
MANSQLGRCRWHSFKCLAEFTREPSVSVFQHLVLNRCRTRKVSSQGNIQIWSGKRASCQTGVSTELLIYRRLNSYAYLVWQMCIISVHTPKCNCLYLCVEQHQNYALLAWHTSHYFMLLDQISPIMQICWYALLEWCPRYKSLKWQMHKYMIMYYLFNKIVKL